MRKKDPYLPFIDAWMDQDDSKLEAFCSSILPEDPFFESIRAIVHIRRELIGEGSLSPETQEMLPERLLWK